MYISCGGAIAVVVSVALCETSGSPCDAAVIVATSISPSIATDGAGNLHMVWVDDSGSGPSEKYGVYHMAWSGTTHTWSARQPVVEYAWNRYVDEWPLATAIGAYAAGNLHVAWAHKRDSRRDIKHRSYSVASQSWSPVAHVTDTAPLQTPYRFQLQISLLILL